MNLLGYNKIEEIDVWKNGAYLKKFRDSMRFGYNKFKEVNNRKFLLNIAYSAFDSIETIIQNKQHEMDEFYDKTILLYEKEIEKLKDFSLKQEYKKMLKKIELNREEIQSIKNILTDKQCSINNQYKEMIIEYQNLVEKTSKLQKNAIGLLNKLIV